MYFGGGPKPPPTEGIFMAGRKAPGMTHKYTSNLLDGLRLYLYLYKPAQLEHLLLCM